MATFIHNNLSIGTTSETGAALGPAHCHSLLLCVLIVLPLPSNYDTECLGSLLYLKDFHVS